MVDQQDSTSKQHEEGRDNLQLGIMVIIIRVLTGKGVNNAAAVRIAMDIIKELTATYGGHSIYLPKQDAVKHAEKAASILAEFNGKNHAALAEKHELSSRQIYNIVGRKKDKKPEKPDVAGLAALLKSRQGTGHS